MMIYLLFISSRSNDDCLYAGNTVVQIEGFGTITVTVQTLNGPQIIKPLNAALVPPPHTSVASLDRFIAKNVHWDSEGKRLHSNGQTLCSIECYHGQWVLEYNAPTHIAFIARSTQPWTNSTASSDT
jgi:hypothetical protein